MKNLSQITSSNEDSPTDYTDLHRYRKFNKEHKQSVKSVGDINPTTKRNYTDYYLLEESPTDYTDLHRYLKHIT